MGIKLLKLLGWELPFAEQIKQFRREELSYLQKDAVYVAINSKCCTRIDRILVSKHFICSIHHTRLSHPGHNDHIHLISLH